MITGRNVGLMYGTESTYGTAVAATTAIGGKVQLFSPTKNNNTLRIRGLGEGRNISKLLYGPFDVAGTITWDLADLTFLRYLIGPLTGAGTSDAAPKILTEADEFGVGEIDSFTLIANKEDGSTDMEDTYSGCVLVDCTISGAETGAITATATFVAKSFSTDTAIANAFTKNTLTPYVGQQASLKWGGTPTTVAKISNWSVTITNNPVIYRSIASRLIEQPVAGPRDYTFTIAVRESQTIQNTLMANFLGDASEPFTPNTGVTSADVTADLNLQILLAEGAGSGDRKATIKFDQATLIDDSEAIERESNEIVQVIYNGTAKEGESNVPFSWVD